MNSDKSNDNLGGERLLEIEGLGKSYGSKLYPLRAVNQVSFSINRGETLGLVGESGSGKSTIGRLITRLTAVTSGRILYYGRNAKEQGQGQGQEQGQSLVPTDLARLSNRQMQKFRSQIQIIFQDPYASFNPRMRVRQILSEALDTHGLAKGSARQPRLVELLEQVGLHSDHLERFPHEFSGGQRQRIGIARALAVEPKFIVADEPLSALDLSVQAQVVNLLSDLKERLGLTLLFISHDLDLVEYLCDRVVVLYLGKVMEIATAEQLYRKPQHPYTQALLAASPIPDPRQRTMRKGLEGDIANPMNPPSGCVFRTRCPMAIADCATVEAKLTEREAGSGHWNSCWRSL